MIKRISLFVVLIVLAMILCGCTYDIVDTTYNFNRAIIRLPDGEIVAGEVEAWKDYEDGDQLQVKINGTTYLTHSENVVLIKEK